MTLPVGSSLGEQPPGSDQRQQVTPAQYAAADGLADRRPQMDPLAGQMNLDRVGLMPLVGRRRGHNRLASDDVLPLATDRTPRRNRDGRPHRDISQAGQQTGGQTGQDMPPPADVLVAGGFGRQGGSWRSGDCHRVRLSGFQMTCWCDPASPHWGGFGGTAIQTRDLNRRPFPRRLKVSRSITSGRMCRIEPRRLACPLVSVEGRITSSLRKRRFLRDRAVANYQRRFAWNLAILRH